MAGLVSDLGSEAASQEALVAAVAPQEVPQKAEFSETQVIPAVDNTPSNAFHAKHLNHIKNIIQQKKIQQEQEAQAAQRTQALARKLAKQVLGSSFDQITSRSWALPTMSSASRTQPKQQDIDDGSGHDQAEATALSSATRLPSLTEDRAEAGTTKIRSRRVTTSDAEGIASLNNDARKVSRRVLQKSVSQEHQSDRSESPSKLPSRNSRGEQATSGGLAPGASLYYQAKAAQEASAQLLAKAYGAGATYAAYLQWRRRHKIPDHVKVFCMGGGGHHSSGIRAGLVERGWHENTDGASPFFDFKWSISPQDIQYELLWSDQVVNHFSKSHCLTTKVGLCKTIRNLAWYEAADYNALYPRGYDLSDEVDRTAWMEDTRRCAAAAIVKRAAAEQGVNAGGPGSNIRANGCSVDLPALRLALRVCVAHLTQDSFLCCDANSGSGNPPPPVEITPAEYDTLLKHPCLQLAPPATEPPGLDESWFDRPFITSLRLPKQGKGRRLTGTKGGAVDQEPTADDEQAVADDGEHPAGYLDCVDSACHSPCRTPDGCSSGTSCPSESSDEAGSNVSSRKSTPDKPSRQPNSEPGAADAQELPTGQQDSWPLPTSTLESNTELQHLTRPALPALDVTDQQICTMDARDALALAARVQEALECWNVQSHMDGMNNIWIVKPAGKSRGRGIRLFNNMDKLLEYIKGEDALSLEWRWVAQKYVERPLIVSRRKFDIRQWVMVTSWSPLCVWFWDTCYLRFAADDYDPSNLDIYLHLSNNSIAKYYQAPKDDDITAQGNMWDVPRFKEWMAEQYGCDDLWERLILPAMQHIVVCTTRCAQDMVQGRKNSCQLYGYDFLIDDQLRVWLLEVNSSPTMEASTAITTELCAEVQEDILKLVVDNPPGASPSSLSNADTGRWECIVDAATELRVPTYTGLSLELKGQGMAATKKPQQTPLPTAPSNPAFPVWGASKPASGVAAQPSVAQTAARVAASVYATGNSSGPTSTGANNVSNNISPIRSLPQRVSLVEQQSLHRGLQAEKSAAATKTVTVPQALNSSPFHTANRLAAAHALNRSISPKKLPPSLHAAAKPNPSVDAGSPLPDATPYGGVISSRAQSARRQSTSPTQPSVAAIAPPEPAVDASRTQPQSQTPSGNADLATPVQSIQPTSSGLVAGVDGTASAQRPSSARHTLGNLLEGIAVAPFSGSGVATAQSSSILPRASIGASAPLVFSTPTPASGAANSGPSTSKLMGLCDAVMLLRETPLNRSGSLPATVMPRCMLARNASTQMQSKHAAPGAATLSKRLSSDLMAASLQQLAAATRPPAPSTPPPPAVAPSFNFMRQSLPSSLISLTALSSNSRTLFATPPVPAAPGTLTDAMSGQGSLMSPRTSLWQSGSYRESPKPLQSTPFLHVRSMGRQPPGH